MSLIKPWRFIMGINKEHIPVFDYINPNKHKNPPISHRLSGVLLFVTCVTFTLFPFPPTLFFGHILRTAQSRGSNIVFNIKFNFLFICIVINIFIYDLS